MLAATFAAGCVAGPAAPDAFVAPTCELGATTVMHETSSTTVTGTGSVTCSAPATLRISVCVFRKGPGDADWGGALLCEERDLTGSNDLSVDAAVWLTPGTAAADYRTVVVATIDGVAAPTKMSDPITASSP